MIEWRTSERQASATVDGGPCCELKLLVRAVDIQGQTYYKGSAREQQSLGWHRYLPTVDAADLGRTLEQGMELTEQAARRRWPYHFAAEGSTP